jgi:hypothetical protein
VHLSSVTVAIIAGITENTFPASFDLSAVSMYKALREVLTAESKNLLSGNPTIALNVFAAGAAVG